ncbi:MAG: hypothetical protein KDA50_07870 [Rhodobacteraceae bacterium]|nr:hypothetical protein [Paracoccaceae bacterium]
MGASNQLLQQEKSQAAPIRDGIAPVAAANTRRLPLLGQWFVDLEPDPGRAALPVVDPSRTDPAAGQLRRLQATGAAAGLAGVLYDNRDRGHSLLPPESFPQLSQTRYDDSFQKEFLDHGAAGKIHFALPVLGNSSTAYTRPPMDRSLARIVLADQANAMRAQDLYAANHLYVYPEHRDHDADLGDRLFAMAPFFILSQGSSYSDRPFLAAAASILAALRPETREFAEARGLIAPTIQMILHRTLAGVRSDADYLSPAAHPTAIDKTALRPSAMITLANSLTGETLPPMVRLRVVRDLQARPGSDYLAANLGERVFTTPSAIGRVWRAFDYTRSISLDASATLDPNGRSLTFHWVVLSGDPEHIRITPQDDRAARVDIEIDWHDPSSTQAPTAPRTTRVEIAAFADNGAHVSAPAYFSIALPIFQNREYDLSGQPARLRALNYGNDPGDPYLDPAIWPTAPWTDHLSWSADGELRIARQRTGEPDLTLVRGAGGFSAPEGPLVHQALPEQTGPLQLHADPDGRHENQ